MAKPDPDIFKMRMSPWYRNKLETLCAAKGITKAAAVRVLLMEWFVRAGLVNELPDRDTLKKK